MKKEIPILILHFNKFQLTVRLLASILKTGFPQELIFCFDNGSLPEVSNKISRFYPKINQKRTIKNSGYAGGFNQAFEWIFNSFNEALFLTNDTIYTKDCEILLSDFSNSGNFGIVAPCIRYLKTPEKIDSIGGYFNRNTFSLAHYREEKLSDSLNYYDYVPGTALFLKKYAFELLNGVDESYFMFWEDVDFTFRAIQNNIKVGRSYNSVIYHGMGQTTRKKPLYTTYYYQRNRIKFCKKFLSDNELENSLKIIRRDLDFLLEKNIKNNKIKNIEYINMLIEEL